MRNLVRLQVVWRWIATLPLVAGLPRRRVPVLLQLNATECGAACLAMILQYHGRNTPVTECRDVCGVGRDGTSAQAITRAARSYGLRAAAYSLEPAELKYIRVPVIVHWEFNHFVVVERWAPDWVDIVDPAIGRRRLTSTEFAAGMTGVVLTFEPSVHFEPHIESSRRSHRDYLASMFSSPGAASLLLQAIGSSLCLLVLGLALPLFTKIVVDRVYPHHIAGIMGTLALGLVLIVIAQAIAGYLRAALLLYLRGRLDVHMMSAFFEHLLSLPFSFFQHRNSGDLLMRLGSNTVIREALTSQTLSALLDGALVVVYLAILLVRAPWFGAVVLVAGALQLALLLGTSRRRRDLTQRDLAAQSASQSYLVEALSGVAALKASGTEDHAFEHWSSLFAAELNASLRRGQLSAILEAAMAAVHTLSPLLLLWVGTLQVLNGAMSLGTTLGLVALSGAFLVPLSSLASNAQRMQLVVAHLERIADVLDAKSEQNPRLAHGTPQLTGRIEVREISFRFDPNSPFILRNISLVIEPGQKIALVGRTGTGKSTLAMLLLGLYMPTEGEILFDGVPLRHLNYRAVRSQIGAVLQEPFLFSGSLRQNIVFGNPGLGFDQIVDAARLAAIHEEIVQMPMGYETRVAEAGIGLSGGQRQRLSLARALARKPAVLILDEATSHLDVVTERIVEQNLSGLACARLVIAHRLSTIRDADRIIVLEDGRIAEQGSHEELASRQGRYSALICGQTGLQVAQPA